MLEKAASVVYALLDVPSELKDGDKVISQQHVASVLPWATWKTSHTDVIWMVKWSPKGLVPIRPVVLVTTPFEVEQGKWARLGSS